MPSLDYQSLVLFFTLISPIAFVAYRNPKAYANVAPWLTWLGVLVVVATLVLDGFLSQVESNVILTFDTVTEADRITEIVGLFDRFTLPKFVIIFWVMMLNFSLIVFSFLPQMGFRSNNKVKVSTEEFEADQDQLINRLNDSSVDDTNADSGLLKLEAAEDQGITGINSRPVDNMGRGAASLS